MDAIRFSVRSKDALVGLAPGVYQEVFHLSLSEVYHCRKAYRVLLPIYRYVTELKNPGMNLLHRRNAARIGGGSVGAGGDWENRA